MNRRRFILNGAGLLVPFNLSCSRKKKKGTVIGPNEPEEPQGEVPYYEADYSVADGVSDSNGVAEIYSKKGLDELKVVDDKNKPIGGLEVILHEENKFGSKVFYIADPDRKYIPNLFVQQIGKRAGLDTIIMYAKELFDRGKEIIVNKLDISTRIENSIPSWNPNRIDNVPGFVYMGDWSFNELKEMNGVLQDTSAIISVLAPNPMTSAAYGILSKTGVVLDKIDNVIDWINELSDFEIDKDRKFPIYKPTLNSDNLIHLIISLGNVKRSENYDIKTLWPLQVGNWWFYTEKDVWKNGIESFEWKVDSIEEMDGKEYTRFNNQGEIDYYGFKQNSLYFYGIIPYPSGQYGNLCYMLETPVKIGDDKIKIGNVYDIETKLVEKSKGMKNKLYSGTREFPFRMKVSWEEKGNLVIWGVPYGNCIKARIESNFSEDKYGIKTIDNFNSPTYRWYAKNLGMVKGTVLRYNYFFEMEAIWNRNLYRYELNSS